jgi:hypothetical protein
LFSTFIDASLIAYRLIIKLLSDVSDTEPAELAQPRPPDQPWLGRCDLLPRHAAKLSRRGGPKSVLDLRRRQELKCALPPGDNSGPDPPLALRPNGKIAVAASKPGGRERHDQLPLDLAVLRFGGR